MSGQMTSGLAASDRAFQRILSSIKQLPSPSDVCLAVTRATEAQQTTLADMQQLVESDIALSGRLMQVANSAFFGIREQVTSVRRAISLLGFGTVRTLALGFFFNEEFGKLQLPGLPYPDLPRFALSSSVLAEVIAGYVDENRKAEAACLGLLHESGVIIMAMSFGSHYRQMLHAEPGDSAALGQLEEKTFGFNHALAAKMLFESWRLGPDLINAVANHHCLDAPQELPSSCAALWRILSLAQSLALPLLKGTFGGSRKSDASGAEPQAGQPLQDPRELARHLLGWSPEQLVDVLKDSARMYRERLAILGRRGGANSDKPS